MRSLLQRCALVLGAVVGLLGTRPATANAQKALVYCPVSIDATGCNAIVAALTGPTYPLGVDRGYDGTGGTVDLKVREDVKAYSEVKVGDTITVSYTEGLALKMLPPQQ